MLNLLKILFDGHEEMYKTKLDNLSLKESKAHIYSTFLVQSALSNQYGKDTNKQNLLTSFIKMINQQNNNRSQDDRRSNKLLLFNIML